MTQEATRYRCPCCGASLVFGGLSQQLDCPSCGNSFPVETIQEIDSLHVENTTDEQLQWTPAQLYRELCAERETIARSVKNRPTRI